MNPIKQILTAGSFLKSLGLLLTLCLSTSLSVHAETTDFAVSLPELQQALAEGRSKNVEFREIKKMAEELGIRVWLFGGTASSFAHYVKWDLQRQKGDSKYQDEHFNYDYTEIYRSTQDMDLVMDGTAEQAEILQQRLSQKFPYFEGSKETWEVRLLKESSGNKEALLNNPDFLNQHSDSNSTGMIEVTDSQEPLVKDLRDWDSETPHFLKDVQKGEITYYHSKKHKQTKRYKDDMNPEIFSVIRYFTKLFQYELTPKEKDLQKLKQIIQSFSEEDLKSGYAINWVEHNGKKLMLHAVDVEYAWDVLEKTGLRKKLIEIKGDTDNIESLAWWLNKEPLRTKPLGKKGQTAKELGLDIVAHETSDFRAYEIITKSKKGLPNVFVSRENTAGEWARFGEGFYTAKGKEGTRGTGFTIRFKVNPEAREGKDFTDYDFVIIKNKSAIEVIPESLHIGFKEYFEILSRGENNWSQDKGLLEKLKRKINNELSSERVNKEDVEFVYNLIKKVAKERNLNIALVQEWFSFKISLKFPDLLQQLIEKGDQDVLWEIIYYVLPQEHWKDHSELLQQVIEKGDQWVLRAIAGYVLSQEHWAGRPEHPEFLQQLIEKGNQKVLKAIATYVFSKRHSVEYFELLQQLIEKGDQDVLWAIAYDVLPKRHSVEYSEFLQQLIEKGNQKVLETIELYAFSQEHWKNHHRFSELESLLKSLKKQHWMEKPSGMCRKVFGWLLP